jgi:hypothetical protein
MNARNDKAAAAWGSVSLVEIMVALVIGLFLTGQPASGSRLRRSTADRGRRTAAGNGALAV